ncbi:MAG: sugar phosphate isomerase/epimerase [Thermoprotei archaeon]|nr:MAG: sugar phosphate isomerase/epimerase [Thermoprotei archaeon]
MKVGTVFWHKQGASFVKEFEFLKEVGFDGIELTVSEKGERIAPISARGYLRIESLMDDAKELLKAKEETGLEIHSIRSGLLWKYPLTSTVPSIREKAIEIIEKEIKLCSYLEATGLLIVPGVVMEDIPYDVAYNLSLEAIRRLVRKAEEEDVFLCIENVENNFLLSPLEMRKFIDEVNSEKVGAYLDIGNVLARYQAFPQHWIRILGKRIKKVHLKDYSKRLKSIVYLLQGDVNWPEVIRSLKEIGYNDYLTAELPPYRLFYNKFFKELAETIRLLITL